MPKKKINIYPVVIYTNLDNKRARITATNGNVIYGSTEGYKNQGDLDDNIRTTHASLGAYLKELDAKKK